MTPAEIYDWMTAHGVIDPAVVKLGDRCITGRWESVGEQLPNGYICRSGKLAVHVLAEGLTWEEAAEAMRARLEPKTPDSRAPAGPDAPISYRPGPVPVWVKPRS